jgi:hypothetical protein
MARLKSSSKETLLFQMPFAFEIGTGYDVLMRILQWLLSMIAILAFGNGALFRTYGEGSSEGKRPREA